MEKKKLNKLETICMGSMFAIPVMNVKYCRLPLYIKNCDSLGTKYLPNSLRLCHFDINKKIEEVRKRDESDNDSEYMLEPTEADLKYIEKNEY